MSTMTQKHRAPGQSVGPRTARKSTASQPPSVMPVSAGAVTHECIQTRAYQIYQARMRNGGIGDAKSDWLQAELELNGLALDPSAAADIDTRAQARGEKLLASGK